MAYLPRNIITVEGLGGDEKMNMIRNLVDWGSLKKNEDAFSLEPEEHIFLLSLFDLVAISDSGAQDVEWKMHQELIQSLMLAVLDDFKKMRITRAMEMLIHAQFLRDHIGKRLPPLPLDYAEESIATGALIFCAGEMLRLSLAVSRGLVFGGALGVCWAMQCSSRQTNKKNRDFVLLGFIIAMEIYMLVYIVLHLIKMFLSLGALVDH
jgi:hypothetical protein